MMKFFSKLPRTVAAAAAVSGAATVEEELTGTKVTLLTCGGGEGAFNRSSKSWTHNTFGDGKASRAAIVGAFLLAVMAAARGTQGVAIVSDDVTEMLVEGLDAVDA